MIIVKLFGGIGNQMFQYAAGRRAALRHGAALSFDRRWFGTQGARRIAVEDLQTYVCPTPPGEDHLLAVPSGWTGAGRAARIRAKIVARSQGWHLLAEKVPGVFDPQVLSARDGSYMVGYWQSERYFKDIATTLRDEFRPRAHLSPWAQRMAAEIRSSGAVSIHVRRGDYASDGRARRAHGAMSLDYYSQATDLLDERLSQPTYFAFSDDPRWVLDNFQHPRLRVVSAAAAHPDAAVEELLLMSLCRAHVVANSSYSWWGAWLGRDPAKVVVAPARWFADPRLRSDDIVPDDWLQI